MKIRVCSTEQTCNKARKTWHCLPSVQVKQSSIIEALFTSPVLKSDSREHTYSLQPCTGISFLMGKVSLKVKV